ncbi:hypothetical protein AVEN_83957-1 [Araneus ventricosus]|uniref:Uncharacterized protein n=1 Tax=Araneus ventricosus TaxID=182803 RepID=A0A4Y2BT72_ARAVE|nr:hypothetical protein AVEN_83957-1 [Araneus ventricosus]
MLRVLPWVPCLAKWAATSFPSSPEPNLAGPQPGQSLVEVVLRRMVRNTLSDLSGTSHSPARETSWPFRGARYQGVDCSVRWGIEGVPWWRSLDFLWTQLRANAAAPGQRMMTTGTRLFRHSMPLESITFGLDIRNGYVGRQACECGCGVLRMV